MKESLKNKKPMVIIRKNADAYDLTLAINTIAVELRANERYSWAENLLEAAEMASDAYARDKITSSDLTMTLRELCEHYANVVWR